jgi:replicative DNA helicase
MSTEFLYESKIAKIFDDDNFEHRSLQTILNPHSSVWDKTTMDEKIEMLQKIIKNGEVLEYLVESYQADHISFRNEEVAKSSISGLCEIITYMVKEYSKKIDEPTKFVKPIPGKKWSDFPEKQPIAVSKTAKKFIDNFINPNYKNNEIIKTGFADLDKIDGGFHLGEMIVLAGDNGNCKDQFMINLALNMSLHSKVGFISLHDSKTSLLIRMLSCLSEIPTFHLNEHKLSEINILNLKNCAAELEKRELIINDNYIHSTSFLIEQCKKMVIENGVKIIFFESLTSNDDTKHLKNIIEYDLQLLCRELKKVALELNICIVVSSKLTFKNDKDGVFRPYLTQLRNETQQYADRIMLLHLPCFYDLHNTIDERLKNVFNVHLCRNRMGSLATIELHVNNSVTTFTDTNDYTSNYFYY